MLQSVVCVCGSARGVWCVGEFMWRDGSCYRGEVTEVVTLMAKIWSCNRWRERNGYRVLSKWREMTHVTEVETQFKKRRGEWFCYRGGLLSV